MTLTIDIGNTRVKWVLFQDEAVIDNGVFGYTLDTFKDCFIRAAISLEGAELVISNVAGNKIEESLTGILETSGCKNYMYVQTQIEQCGVTNAYSDFSRLGVDRWLAMIAGFNHEKRAEGESVCIIDCGTAMTLDIVDGGGHHLGGLITPGYRLMRSVLIQKTNNIKGIDTNPDVASMGLAKTTDDAVRQGCVQLLVGGLSDMLSRYSENKKNEMCCIVTGGDADWVTNLLRVEAMHEPMLVNLGLCHVFRASLKAETKGCT